MGKLLKIFNLRKNRIGGENLIAQRVKELRLASKMTQSQLALKVGAKQKQTIAQWEKGTSVPPLSSCMKLAEIFGVSLDYLVGNEQQVLVNVTHLPQELAEIVRNTAKQLEEYTKKNNKH